MNAITLRGGPEPVVPELLEAALRAYLRPTKVGRPAVEEFQAAVTRIPPTQAQRVADLTEAYEAHLAIPVNRPALVAWLTPLCTVVGVPPTAESFDGRVAGVLAGAAELPLACLNARSFAAAVRAFKFWPSARELIDLLEQHAGIMRSRQRALEAVHGLMCPPGSVAPAAKREGPTPAEIEAVAALVETMTTEMAAGRPGLEAGTEPAAKPKIKPSYLSPAILAATLRRDIAGLPPHVAAPLKARLAILERQHPEVRLNQAAKAAE